MKCGEEIRFLAFANDVEFLDQENYISVVALIESWEEILGIEINDTDLTRFLTVVFSEFEKEVYDFNRLKKVLKNFDYVVNTLPLTDETEGMVGKTVFDSMRKDAYYVSVGRGGTTVEGELIDALDNDKIAGAFLDVFAVEPLPAESPLWKHSKVMLSPHTSGITDYYNERIINSFLRNFECYRDGKDIEENLVDYKRQY